MEYFIYDTNSGLKIWFSSKKHLHKWIEENIDSLSVDSFEELEIYDCEYTFLYNLNDYIYVFYYDIFVL